MQLGLPPLGASQAQIMQDLNDLSVASQFINATEYQQETVGRAKDRQFQKQSEAISLGGLFAGRQKTAINQAKNRAKAWQVIQNYLPTAGQYMVHIR